jgi:hypothetical protein
MMLKKGMFDKLKYNLSLKVWNTYYLKNIDMFTFVEIYTFDLLENLSLRNKFN